MNDKKRLEASSNTMTTFFNTFKYTVGSHLVLTEHCNSTLTTQI